MLIWRFTSKLFRLNYPGCMGLLLRLRLYLNEYLSDLHVFLYQLLLKLNIILKSERKKKKIFFLLFFHSKFPESYGIASNLRGEVMVLHHYLIQNLSKRNKFGINI